ncbi:MAG: hypothetical protein ACI4XM_01385 [Candidatus Coprovivens sp.]
MNKDYEKIYDEEDSRNYENFDDLEDDDFKDYIDDEIDETYENVYDVDGDSVYCDYCNSEIKWKDGEYICPNCGQVMNLDTFLNYIGVDITENK